MMCIFLLRGWILYTWLICTNICFHYFQILGLRNEVVKEMKIKKGGTFSPVNTWNGYNILCLTFSKFCLPPWNPCPHRMKTENQ